MPRFALFGLLALGGLAVALEPAARAQQTSATFTTGPVSVRLKRVNTVSGGANANIVYGTTAPGDSRLFVVQQGTNSGSPATPGRIRYFNPGVVDSAVGTLLDFSVALPGVLDDRHFEKGLLGLAFHPEFNNPASPGFLKFYTYSTERVAAHGTPTFVHPELAANPTNDAYDVQTIREWTANSTTPTGVTGASRIVMTILDPQNQHNGGTIAFSPVDGYLYWGVGDGGGNSSQQPDFSATAGQSSTTASPTNPGDGHTNANLYYPGSPHGNGQDRRNPMGAMLRFNPLPASVAPDAACVPSPNGQYQIPIDNPFTMASNINPETSQPYPSWEPEWVDEIYAYGLRNPYRFSFDPGASLSDPKRGTLYLNDPGWDNREEVDVIVKGANYGWAIREGTDVMAGTTISQLNPPVTLPAYIPPPNAKTGLPDTLVDPVAEYDDTIGVATIGGFVYRGWKESTLYGKYIFGDTNGVQTGVDALLMYLDPDEVKAPNAPYTIYKLGISSFGASMPSGTNRDLLGFGQGADGLIYAMIDTGEIYALNPLFTADFDHDGKVDQLDLAIWKNNFGPGKTAGDADGDGDTDGADYLIWQRQLGSGIGTPPPATLAPEPTAAGVAVVAALALLATRRRATYR
jgi:hypothetical protein